MICARVAGVPRPFSRIASRNSSSSISLPAPSIAESSVASVNRGGGRVTSALTSTFSVVTFSLGFTGVSVALVAGRFLAVHGEPARVDQHLAFRLERLALDPRDARGDEILGRGIEHREEALDDHVVELLLELDRLFGRTSVGMIAKWSETFALSKIRLFGRTHFFFRISRANVP